MLRSFLDMASAKKKTFLIVDGHALLHRAWHALPPLSTKDGLVVHGAYGFTMILLSALKKFQPDYAAVTFDLKGPTFRHVEYEDYKGTREKKPDELYAQVPILEKVLKAMSIPVFTAQGFEADDVIGTLSLRAADTADVETIIATGDMDTLQLVDKRTKVFTLRKGFSDTVVYDEAAVKERYGFKPTQLIDYKALRGDPSDNIPGVRGIGEKTGSELVATFGTIEALYDSIAKNDKKAKALKAGVREKLVAHEKEARQAKRLCTIKRDVKLDFSLEDCAYAPADRAAVEPVFRELEFMKLLKQFPGGYTAEAAVAAAPAPGTASMFGNSGAGSSARSVGADAAGIGGEGSVFVAQPVSDVASLDAALRKLERSVLIAFRTVGLRDSATAPNIKALLISDGRMTFTVRGAALKDGRPLLNAFLSRKNDKICHDLKREWHSFVALGLDATAAIGGGCFDLMLASYLQASGERRHSLAAILAYGRSVPLEDEPEDLDGRIALAARQLAYFPSLAEEFTADLKKSDLRKLYDEIEAPLAPVLARMEEAGIGIDKPYLAKLSTDLAGKIDKITVRVHDAAGEEFNLNSPAQLKIVLFDKLGISSLGLKRTGKTKELSTAAAELEKLRGAHPIVSDILEYRELAKLKSTYVDALPDLVDAKTGRIHAEFNQTVAATGRLSSSNPNLQNIPTPETENGKRVRDAFVAPPGRTLIAADYSQFELRIVAHIAKEKAMIEAFKNGEDIHWRTAAEMFGAEHAKDRRRIAKVINFGILYGMGPQRLAESAEISFLEAREYIERYFEIHKGIAKYMESIKERIVDEGYVETLSGRKRFFRNVKLMNPRERAEAERQAINMPVQGSQADMVKKAMLGLDRLIAADYPGGQVKMISQVHDELLFEVEAGIVEKFIMEMEPIMTGVADLVVPITVNVSVGERWGSMEKRA